MIVELDTIRTAKVIDNVDEDKLGRIKVRIYPELIDVEEADLPWVEAYEGANVSNGSYSIPEINSFVKVAILDNFWMHIRYMPLGFSLQIDKDAKWSDLKSNISEITSSTYPQPNILQWFADGSFIFRDTETSETGYYMSSGSYFLFKGNGEIYLQNSDGTTFNIKSDKKATIESADGGTIVAGQKNTFKTTSADLKDILDKILGALESALTPGNLIGNLGAPIIFTGVGTHLPNIIAAKSVSLPNLLE